MLVRWDPFPEVRTLQEEMNRLFDGFTSKMPPAEKGALWSPDVDIYEDENNYILKAELPGLKREEVEVRTEGRTLTLRGERKTEKNIKEENYHLVERCYGRFVRSFTLPSNIDAAKVTADFKDGVLEIAVPKIEGPKPKVIPVNAG